MTADLENLSRVAAAAYSRGVVTYADLVVCLQTVEMTNRHIADMTKLAEDAVKLAGGVLAEDRSDLLAKAQEALDKLKGLAGEVRAE